jgi:hypothetical protein
MIYARVAAPSDFNGLRCAKYRREMRARRAFPEAVGARFASAAPEHRPPRVCALVGFLGARGSILPEYVETPAADAIGKAENLCGVDPA